MNKFAKVMLGAAAVACLGSAIAFSGCAKDPVIETYEGGYQYNSWNTNYGVKVKVTTEDGVISKVETLESDWHNVSASWDGHDATVAAIPEYLAKFEGKTLAEYGAEKKMPVSTLCERRQRILRDLKKSLKKFSE